MNITIQLEQLKLCMKKIEHFETDSTNMMIKKSYNTELIQPMQKAARLISGAMFFKLRNSLMPGQIYILLLSFIIKG